MTRTNPIFSLAEKYVRAGLSVIPIRSDGSKAPAIRSWKPYCETIATSAELKEWFNHSSQIENHGIAVICGNVSGNLEVLDVDSGASIAPLLERIDSQVAGLSSRLTRVATPSGGMHLYYRCSAIQANQKLAMRKCDNGKETLVETRGEGGYVIAPGSPPECHLACQPYTHCGGPPIHQIPTIDECDRDALLSAARSLNEVFPPVEQHPTGATRNRPGDVFNQTASWAEILEPHGWVQAQQAGDTIYWRRPGKNAGWSASTGRCTNDQSGDLLYVFSSNADPFEAGRAYNKFAAHALLNNSGNFREAAREIMGPEQERRTASILLNLASDIELFHTPEREAYATFNVNGHFETAAVRSRDFRQWLGHRFYEQERRPANQQAMNEAVETLEGKACFGGSTVPVHIRLAECDEKIYLDLADPDWTVIEISADGWQTACNPPVRFRRTQAMQSLPVPVLGGDIEELRQFLNSGEMEWRLMVGVVDRRIAAQRSLPCSLPLRRAGDLQEHRRTLASQSR